MTNRLTIDSATPEQWRAACFHLELENRKLREALERAAKPARREFSGNDTHRLDECRAIINEALRSSEYSDDKT